MNNYAVSKIGSKNPQYKHGLEEYRTFEWLDKMYNQNQLSLSQVALLVGITRGCIQKWFKKVGIKCRKDGARSGKLHFNFKGSYLNTQGYRVVYSPQHPHKDARNCVREHILIAEKILGRFINYPQEVVHHINEDKLDNRPENLYFFSDRKKHDKYHQMKRMNSLNFVPITQSNLSMNA